ncbi:ABC transporter substrate-binding protein [Mycobacterium sp. ITM-2016-00317]|uniref:ABC transporter substrate-binding protein n=1 Tax=Mycobacterium sp. ITM-2016-00317 TaxID=2099694 RepID=UPI000D44165D|nr:ABC transporter substrate-binding protein [Mycobacterium sp. ITM-2016-00317]WNG89159.1 ABC transporter substrate-binding protein [Mycobacterium sp. ITM-2016-00317]
MTQSRRRGALVLSALAVAVSGCAPEASESPEAVDRNGFPVTIDNCGQQIVVETPPRSAIGYFQHPVELMLELGLRDSVAATVYPDNPPLPRHDEAYRAIPELSNKDASLEQLLSVAPDFVYGGYASAFDESAGRSRQALTDAGVTTYLNPEYCATEPITMDDVYGEVRTIAEIFGVGERADALVETMQSSVDSARERVAGVEPLKAFVYDSGEDSAFTAGRQGIGNQIIDLAGATNIFADLDDTFADVSWEQVIERNPDVIVIYDYFGTPSVEQKKQFLKSRPELATVTAIRDDRFAVLTLQDAVLGIRAPFAVEALARQLHPDRF